MTIVTPDAKICSNRGCESAGLLQPLANFGRNDSVASGLSYYCRQCATRTQSEWKKAHPEAAKKWRRTYIERNKARNAAKRGELTITEAANESAGTATSS